MIHFNSYDRDDTQRRSGGQGVDDLVIHERTMGVTYLQDVL